MGTGRERVEADAAARGIAVEFVERTHATELGLDRADFVKSMLVKRHNGTFLFALVPLDRQIAWPKLRAVVGVNKLLLPDASVALAVTGYERGTITPLGSAMAWPVFADERIAGRRIGMGSGEHGVGAVVDADQLIAGLQATVADISA
ncbi:aminoacyl-tRNA deacylase [uncultured Arthrobacter sp.]|uniref:aminoacyl-tRNA deacylase n=1 Tax=uncultured Arthrobacter sp. TaxID=114050 RepID=UPI0025DB4C39|nr:YbaK/EbsC family protein [uncultured Arthrobacter sp.]